MTKILILGATGAIAKHVINELNPTDVSLFARNPERLPATTAAIIQGDAFNVADLTKAMTDVEVVYSNLGPNNMQTYAQNVLLAMHNAHVQRLVWMSTAGIYEEFEPSRIAQARQIWGRPSDVNSAIGDQFAASEMLLNSDLDVTILRPNWLTDGAASGITDVISRGKIIPRGTISRQAVGKFVAGLLNQEDRYVNKSIGLTEG